MLKPPNAVLHGIWNKDLGTPATAALLNFMTAAQNLRISYFLLLETAGHYQAYDTSQDDS
jgi:hypothetical protein